MKLMHLHGVNQDVMHTSATRSRYREAVLMRLAVGKSLHLSWLLCR